MPTGQQLIDEIDRAPAITPTLWWLGHAGFAIKYHHMVFYVDPFLTPQPGRLQPPLLNPADVHHAAMILTTQANPAHMDCQALKLMLAASPRAKVVLPKSTAEYALERGIPYSRMTTTDQGLRVEYFHLGDYMRVYAAPSAWLSPEGKTELGHTPMGGYPRLGYCIRAGHTTIYHSGGCVPFDGLLGFLRPYNVNVALLGVSGPPETFTVEQAATLASAVGARWFAPMHYGTSGEAQVAADRVANHVLGHHPSLRFKVFEPGVAWELPED
jgi:L-ascorbate metabolism protein UlaG (beta-lactamase superfamily)